MQGVIDEMDRRGKGDSAAISSAIDMGETEAVSLHWSCITGIYYCMKFSILAKCLNRPVFGNLWSNIFLVFSKHV